MTSLIIIVTQSSNMSKALKLALTRVFALERVTRIELA
jgi:hypothetical protein